MDVKREYTHDVVLEMLSDSGEVNLHLNACRLQHVRGPNTTVHQHARATHCTARQDHFLPHPHRLSRCVRGARVLDTGRSQVVPV